MRKTITKRIRKPIGEDQKVRKFSAGTGLSKLAAADILRRFGPYWARYLNFRVDS